MGDHPGTVIWKPMTARSVWTCVPMPDRGLILSLLSMRVLLSGQMEKRGIQTNIGNLNREIRAANRLMEGHPAAYPKPQRLDYRAGRKTERTACTKGGGGSDTSSQSTNEIYGDTKGRTEGLDKGWTEPGDFTGLKGSQRSSVLSSAKGAFHCGGLRSISGIFREISRRLPQSDEAKGSPQQSD